ncbi:MAG: ParB/RepB/Spo0J family partition protein [Opitutales bacterium]|nr:ParB/RepB/Spo0J family partition protein [Opitutales bacterium]
MATQRKTLGRGLGAIISAGAKKVAESGAKKVVSQAQASTVKDVKIASHGTYSEVPIDKIIPSPYQARIEFDDDKITQLADSIASEGLLNPLLVRKLNDGKYELLAGERRLRACQKIGLKKVVVCIQTASDASSAAKGLIENLQRADLNPIEEANGILKLVHSFHLTQEAVAQRLGKPRSTIANALRLLKLPEEVRGYISKGLMGIGHAKILMGVDDPVQQTIIARKIIENDLNVRSTEDLIRRMKASSDRTTPGTPIAVAAQNAVIRDIQNKISTRLNASVEIKHTPKRGKIVITYLGNDDLQRILDTIGVKI